MHRMNNITHTKTLANYEEKKIFQYSLPRKNFRSAKSQSQYKMLNNRSEYIFLNESVLGRY
jgi:hypothetical protein